MAAQNVTQWSSEDVGRSVPHYLQHIDRQFGALKFVTEEVLHENLRRQAFTEHVGDESAAHEIGKSQSKRPQDDIRRLRQVLLENLHNAHSQSVLGSDLLSLLIARNETDTAAQSISPTVRDLLPLGSVRSEHRKIHVPTDRQEELERLRAGGLELESFESTVDSIVAAADRLEKKIWQERAYWQEIARIEEQGWLVSQPTPDRHSFRVRIGSGESGLTYNYKSLVGLKSSPDGTVSLDLPSDISRGRRLRVSLYNKGSKLASYCPALSETPNAGSLSVELLKARDSLFDEELFHELSREASRLWNRGVKFTDRGIAIPFDKDIEAVVDLASQEEQRNGQQELNLLNQQNRWHWPETIAISLRILMAYWHQQRRRWRASVPTPLATAQPSRQDANLLIPLISQMQSHIASKAMVLFVQDIRQLFSQVMIDVLCSFPADATHIHDLAMSKQDRTTTTSETLTEAFSNPPPSSYELNFPSISVRFQVMFRVYGGVCEYRYSIASHSPDSLLARLPASIVFPTGAEVIEAATDICRICLVETIQKATNSAWKSSMPQTGEMQASWKGVDSPARKLCLALSQTTLRAEIVNEGMDSETSTVWSVDRESDRTIDLIKEIVSARQ